MFHPAVKEIVFIMTGMETRWYVHSSYNRRKKTEENISDSN